MSIDIGQLVPPSCSLLALGEPTHGVGAFLDVRNGIFAGLAAAGFRSIVLETDRVAAMRVDAYVQGADDSFHDVMRHGFTHGFGESEGNRRLVAWMREHNAGLPMAQRLRFHGFDTPTENTSAPSPRLYLERVRDYLGADVDLTPIGDDSRWSRDEAILDAAQSPGASPEAGKLAVTAGELQAALYERAPELIARTGLSEWQAIRAHADAALGLLGYHRAAARPGDRLEWMTRLLAARDGLMARNLTDIAQVERRRGRVLVFAHNLHVTRSASAMRMPGVDSTWYGAGAIVAAQLGTEYAFVAGSLGRSGHLGVGDPPPGSYEAYLQREDGGVALTRSTDIPASATRTDIPAGSGYFPLDDSLVEGSDAVLHINDTDAVADPLEMGELA